MSQYMLLVYEEEVDAAEQAEREHVTPMLVELHASLREAGLLVDVHLACIRRRARRRCACAKARRRT